MLLPSQCRAARAALRITAAQLADAAGVTRVTVARFESESESTSTPTKAVLRAALERMGAAFVDEGGVVVVDVGKVGVLVPKAGVGKP